MKGAVVIALIIVTIASGCNTPAMAPATGSPAVSYAPANSMANLVSLSGEDSFRTEPITIPAGMYRVAWAVHDPEGSLDLSIGLIHGTDLQPQNQRTWLIRSEVPADSTGVAGFESAGGPFIIAIETMPTTYRPTTWTLTLAPLMAA